MSLSNDQIVDAVAAKSLMEVMELVKAIMTGAAAVTPNFSSMAFTSSITSISDLAATASTI